MFMLSCRIIGDILCADIHAVCQVVFFMISRSVNFQSTKKNNIALQADRAHTHTPKRWLGVSHVAGNHAQPTAR